MASWHSYYLFGATALVIAPNMGYGASDSDGGYKVVHGWPVLPEGKVLDEVSAVGVDKKGNVFVLQRGGRTWPDTGELDQSPIPLPTVMVFDGNTGKLISKWGANLFALPHSITLDSNDNVWVTDVAWHQVFKFSHSGKLMMTLGERGVSGTDAHHFNRPTDVAVKPDGSFYVSDGYRNTRVVKFSAKGAFEFEWGAKGAKAGEFNLPHGIALDKAGQVYVVDRGNARVQVFDARGRFLTEWKGPPFQSPQDIAIGPGGEAIVVDIGRDQLPDRCGAWVLGMNGKVVGRIGRFGNYDGQFMVPHGVAAGKDGTLYVADFSGRRVQKFVRKRS